MKHLMMMDRPLIQITKSYMIDYSNNYDEYDINIRKRYGHLILDTDAESIDAALLAEIDLIIKGVFLLNDKKYDKIVEALAAEFSPIENYDRYEDATITEGQRQDQTSIGEMSTTDTYGQKETTTSYDEMHTDTTIGATSGSITGKVTGFNTSDLATNNRQESESQSQTNSQDTDAYDVTETTEKHADTHVTDARSDSFTKGSQVNTTISHIHGNIGVTQSSDMIRNYVSLYDDINLYEIIFEDVVNAITIPMFGGDCKW